MADYLMGHFTQANVEAFVDKHASGWGSHTFKVRMTWGCPKPLEADVVALSLYEESSELGFQHQVIFDACTGRPALVRKNSPPLGIPLAAMFEMQNEYSKYVQDVVRNDLDHYIWTAYDDQHSLLPERLLRAIGNFYRAGSEVDDEVMFKTKHHPTRKLISLV